MTYIFVTLIEWSALYLVCLLSVLGFPHPDGIAMDSDVNF